MICEMPNKIATTIVTSLTLYFMTNLRREPGAYFIYFLFAFVCTLTMSMYFRCIAALSRTLSQAMGMFTPHDYIRVELLIRPQLPPPYSFWHLSSTQVSLYPQETCTRGSDG